MARYLILLLCLLLQPLLASTQSLTSASAPLITLTAAGTFSVNPNRTITIERPSIDPTSVPVPIHTETSTPLASPTPTLIPQTPNNPHEKSEVNEKLLIGLLVGLVGPIVLLLLFTTIFHSWAFIIRKRKGITLSSWRAMTLPSVPSGSAIGRRRNEKGEIVLYCKNHNCEIDPVTWVCRYSGVSVPDDLRITGVGFWKRMGGSMRVMWVKVRFWK